MCLVKCNHMCYPPVNCLFLPFTYMVKTPGGGKGIRISAIFDTSVQYSIMGVTHMHALWWCICIRAVLHVTHGDGIHHVVSGVYRWFPYTCRFLWVMVYDHVRKQLYTGAFSYGINFIFIIFWLNCHFFMQFSLFSHLHFLFAFWQFVEIWFVIISFM